MSSQALLEAIETAGKEELARLERETQKRVEEILADAEETAITEKEAAYQEAFRPLKTERARRLHQARMDALKITAEARDTVVKRISAQIETRLEGLRQQPEYDDIFRRLLEESVQVLGEDEFTNNHQSFENLPQLEVDKRDQPLARKALNDHSDKLEIVPKLESWGGVVLRSGDGRIVVNNTLETRLEQLKPHLEKMSNFVTE